MGWTFKGSLGYTDDSTSIIPMIMSGFEHSALGFTGRRYEVAKTNLTAILS